MIASIEPCWINKIPFDIENPPKTNADRVACSYHRSNAKSDADHMIICLLSVFDRLRYKIVEILIINWTFVPLMIGYPRRHFDSVRISIIPNTIWTMFTMHPRYK